VIYVQSVGGLGNQLFQVAFAHFLLQKFPGEKVTLFRDKYHQTGRSNEIENILEHCQHHIQFTNGNYLGLLLKILDKVSKHSPSLYQLFSGVLRVNSDDKSAFRSNKKSLVYRGYFQSPNLMRAEIFTTGYELSLLAAKLNLDSPFRSDFTAMHIRQGDFRTNKNIIGVLSSKYYANLKSSFNRLVIATDEHNFTTRLGEHFTDIRILDPSEASPLETLAVLGRSSELFIANSTFSWWAGVIVQLNGGKVYGPTPWNIGSDGESDICWLEFEWLPADYE
jgi:hypothetical protein